MRFSLRVPQFSTPYGIKSSQEKIEIWKWMLVRSVELDIIQYYKQRWKILRNYSTCNLNDEKPIEFLPKFPKPLGKKISPKKMEIWKWMLVVSKGLDFIQ